MRTQTASLFQKSVEWPTFIAIGGCYAVWLSATWFQFPGWWLAAILATGFFASLQHEVLHGHPTRSRWINEALVFPALAPLYPFRRFRDMHLKHHNNPKLTDPYDDPESLYVAEHDWEKANPLTRAVLRICRPLLGRMIVGPWAGFWVFLRHDIAQIRAGNRKIARQWLPHFPAVGLVIAWLIAVDVSLLFWGLCIVWPAAALMSVRTYIEHRAAEAPEHRSAIIEDRGFFALLFLNNNLHALHHEQPALPWYRLPALYRNDPVLWQRRNGGYVLSGYGAVFRRHLLRGREPIVHPLMRKK